MDAVKHIVFVIAALVAIMATILFVAGTGWSDPGLAAIAGLPLVCALIWALAGAPPFPRLAVVIPLMIFQAIVMGASFIAVYRYPPVHPWLLMALCVLLGGVLGGALDWIANHRGKEPFAGLTFLGLVYGAFGLQALLIVGNATRDAAPVLKAAGKVVQTYETTGKNSSMHIVVDGAAAQWSNTMTTGDFDVSARDFDAYHRGMPICVGIHTGVLRVTWYRFEPCPRGKA